MKKSHPTPNPEALYATVNKQNRGNQRTQNPEEEVLYATVNTVDPLSRGGRHAQRREDPETDYTMVAPQQRGKPSASLTAEQKSATLLKDPQVQAYAQEVVHWGQIVYGKDTLFQQQLQDILKDPSRGKELSDQLAENPESMHKLAGRQALGIKNQARREAEEGFRPLVDAIDGYTKAVENATEKLSRTPLAEQRRHHEHAPQTDRAHHHRHHRHERGQDQNSPEQSQHQRRHEQGKGMAYAM